MVAASLTGAERGQRHRDMMRDRRRTESREGQDIGPVPEVKDWARRERCIEDPELFFRTYWGFWPYFELAFCNDHRRVIDKGEEAIRTGGLFALAMPRGFGKTTICRGFAVRAIACGFRRFVLLVGAASSHANLSLDAIRGMLGESQDFCDDFPEISHAILALEGEAKRQGGQRCLGEKTGIHWGGDHIVLPTLPPQKSMRPEQHACAGAKVYAIGITSSRVRGFNVKGERPDFLLPDDPQTEDSARSDGACEKRESILSGMAIGLAGPKKKIAGVMPLTVIRQGDMADNILDHDKHPEWDSSRTKMVYSFPTNMHLWEKYKEIRTNYNPQSENRDKKRAETEATLFYADNDKAMQAGAVLAWPELHAEDELDGLQSAMNLLFQDRRKFFAEKQNDPLAPDLGDIKELKADEIAAKVNGIPRLVVPLEATMITVGVDVQDTLLYYVVAAWRDDFTGHVMDYGTYPDQGRRYFTLPNAAPTLAKVTGIQAVEGQIRKGLDTLIDILLGAEWKREAGGPERVSRGVIDSGHQTTVVYEFCRQSKHAANLYPSKGVFVGASTKKAVGEGKAKHGDRHGLDWALPAAKESRGVKLLLIDTNSWKTFVHNRLAVALGSPSCLSLFGQDPSAHRMFADHLTAEYRVDESSKLTKRSVFVWKSKPGNPDNHWFDCLVMATVAASVQGAALDGIHKPAKIKKRRRVSFAAQRQARARR